MNEKVTVEVKYHSASALWNYFSEKNFSFYDWKEVKEHVYRVSIDYPTYQKMKKDFSLKVIKKKGIGLSFFSLICRFSTLFSIVLSLFSFFLLFTRVHHISVDGENPYLNSCIKKAIEDAGYCSGSILPSSEDLLKLEKEILRQYDEDLEFLEIRKKGVVLHATYRKERKEIVVPQKGDSLYANKGGLISHFHLTSGVKKVRPNQYVTPGTLLVDAYVDLKEEKREYVGAYGSVYAHTWTIYELSIPLPVDAESWENLFFDARYQIAKNFTKEEKIEEEKILQQKEEDGMLFVKIHYTCLEDICKIIEKV